jgi:hypothetical protein
VLTVAAVGPASARSELPNHIAGPGSDDGRARDRDELDPSWPPVLVGGALVLAGVSAGAVIVMMRRARAATRHPRERP